MRMQGRKRGRARHREDWNIPDPEAVPPGRFAEIRDCIGRKVTNLITHIEKS